MRTIEISETHLDEDLDRSKVCDECWQLRSLTGNCACIG